MLGGWAATSHSLLPNVTPLPSLQASPTSPSRRKTAQSSATVHARWVPLPAPPALPLTLHLCAPASTHTKNESQQGATRLCRASCGAPARQRPPASTRLRALPSDCGCRCTPPRPNREARRSPVLHRALCSHCALLQVLAAKPKKGNAVLFHSIKPTGELERRSLHTAWCVCAARGDWWGGLVSRRSLHTAWRAA